MEQKPERRFPFRTNWPSERENIQISVDIERGRTLEKALLDAFGLADFLHELNPKGGEHPHVERDERIGNEALIRWIRDHRAR